MKTTPRRDQLSDSDYLVAITAGDVAGIGPEVVLRALTEGQAIKNCGPVLIGHPEIFRRAAKLAGISVSLSELDTQLPSPDEFRDSSLKAWNSGEIACWNPAGDAVCTAPLCRVSAVAGDAAFQYLVNAIELVQRRCVDAIATAPLNKEALSLAGHHYPGHTEILAEKCGVSDFAMMLHLPESAIAPWRSLVRKPGSNVPFELAASHGISIAHVTLHTAIADVPNLLTVESVSEKVHLMSDFLRRIHCDRQAIAVCALNPHGGENGLFGGEEASIIEPAIEHCRATLPNVSGPYPVDTLIRRAIAGEFDGIIAMYHDQGHIPVKLIGFDAAINITLGLPIVRTSPTHGTAFDRAWNPSTPANASGMREAIRMAVSLAKTSRFF